MEALTVKLEDPMMLFSDILCLSETWLKDDGSEYEMEIPGYKCHLNSVGEGKGIATFFKRGKANVVLDIKRPKVQMTKLSTVDVDILNVYRSQGADNKEMIDDLAALIDIDKITIIVGDLNFCYVDQRNHAIAKYLEDKGFSQHVQEATHLQGGHIDHVYSNHDPKLSEVNIMMYSPYYTYQDHDAIFVTLVKRNIMKVLFVFFHICYLMLSCRFLAGSTVHMEMRGLLLNN